MLVINQNMPLTDFSEFWNVSCVADFRRESHYRQFPVLCTSYILHGEQTVRWSLRAVATTVAGITRNAAVVRKQTTVEYAEGGRNPLFKCVSQWQK